MALDGRRAARFGYAPWVIQNSHRLDDVYEISCFVLGAGSFGSVSLAVCRSTGAERVAKTVQRKGGMAQRQLGGVLNEAEIMAQTDHPFVAKLFEVFREEEQLHMLLEMCVGGDLRQTLAASGPLQVEKASLVMAQVLYAASYLHGLHIVHRDLKLENLLLLRTGTVEENIIKVADFGLSCRAEPGELLSLRVGTLRYSAPELLAGRYGLQCDVWSCGVCMYAILSGEFPFGGHRDEEVAASIKRGNFMLTGPAWNVPEEAKVLVRNLLRHNPQERITAQAAAVSLRTSVEHFLPAPPSCTRLTELIQDFATWSCKRRAVLDAIAWQSDAAKYAPLFLRLDADCDGILSAAELCDALCGNGAVDGGISLVQPVTPLTFTDFVVLMSGESLFLQRHALRAAYRALDRDGDGIVSSADLEGVSGCGEGELIGMDFGAFLDEVRIIKL
mmetsp:Transcript_5508/g.16013  ORF Transcript_5508/g.16013 Transcript_5508/m.16013 type:complete len:445 (+) Transcript_5508:204-1538(+)